MVLPSSPSAARAGNPSLLRFLRTLYQKRQSGILEVFQGEQVRRFYFKSGELHLIQGHPLAQRMSAFLQGPGDGGESLASLLREGPGSGEDNPVAQAAQELRWLLRRIAKFLHQLEGEKFGFQEGADQLPDQLVGPLPTGFLIMESAVMDRTVESLLAELGGETSRWVAVSEGQVSQELTWMEPEEAFLLSRLESPMALGELTRQVGQTPGPVVRLARLRSLGLVEPPEDTVARSAKIAAPEARRVHPDVVRRFLERVGRELEAKPLTLDVEEHRERIGELFASLGEKNFYQLLSVRPDATLEKVLEGYNQLARLVHPQNGSRLQLAGGPVVLDLLFERATEAYLTLSDPSRRGRYNAENRVALIPEDESPEQSQEREQELAREYFERARQMVANQQYHAAHELLREAARREPKAEHYALLAQVQTKNPNWVRQAVDNYRKAVDLAPHAVEHRLSLALTCEEAGYLQEAKLQFERVLEHSPDHPIAGAGLKRIEHQEEPEKGPGLMERIREAIKSLMGRGG